MSEEYIQFQPKGYEPSQGIYCSSQIFTGNWENELQALTYTPRSQLNQDASIRKFDEEKGIHDYLYNSLKSATGTSTFHDTLGEDFWQEESPENFSYTDSYHSSPKLAAICDWFKCEKTRIRIFQQQPGKSMPIHTDFDNRKGTEKHGETLRIFIQLSDMPGGAWFRIKTGDSEMNINLQKGQFLIFSPDHTGHGTENTMDCPRNTIMMVVKRNEWLDNLVGAKSMEFVDVDNAASKTVVAQESVAA